MSTKIGERLKELRQKSGYTFREIEKITNKGISNAYLCQIESGNVKEPSVKHLWTLSKLYNVEFMSLVELVIPKVEPTKDVTISFGARCNGMNQKYEDEFDVPEDISDKEIEEMVLEQAIQATGFEFWWERKNESQAET